MAVFNTARQNGQERLLYTYSDRAFPRFAPCRLLITAAVYAAVLSQIVSAQAQPAGPGLMGADNPRLDPKECLQPGTEPLFRIPELVSENGKLSGTIVLRGEQRRLNDTTQTPIECAEIYLRYFEGVNAVFPPMPPDGTPAPRPSGKYKDPLPGPTLRARVGDIVQLTFLNQVDPIEFSKTFVRGGENSNECDQFPVFTPPGSPPKLGYPASARDSFPDCFHGSTTANIHFHGTHTNPNSTGDNVFLQILPSPRIEGQPTVTEQSVETSFKKFFADCEAQLKKDVFSEWPHIWRDLPSEWTRKQEKLLKAYDAGRPHHQQLWPENRRQIEGDRWPQYYVGAFPYCFRLPEYTAPRLLIQGNGPRMGQAPGLHWYHAHKHGSTTLNVANGMTGAFVIEGRYDDELNGFYGTVGSGPKAVPWTRAQPVLVLNQPGGVPDRALPIASGTQRVSVNGRLQPKLTMRPDEVQLWRIVNTSPRTFVKLLPPTNGFKWRQLAQDGVQFANSNYLASEDKPVLLAPGNRADLLVKAPSAPMTAPYQVKVEETVTRTKPDSTQTLMVIEVAGERPSSENQTKFIDNAPTLPEFLADITDDEVNYSPRRTLVFDSKGPGQAIQHTINGDQFNDRTVGVAVNLNTAEEWKVMNTTIARQIDHPFHIHINPFQVVEVFDPNEKISDPGTPGALLDKYVDKPEDLKYRALQCLLDPNDPGTWRDCHNSKRQNLVWWDVFPIPAAKNFPNSKVNVPGYYRMRSRFVDYPGLYVLHCHILAHEDRGMMTIVQVAPVAPGWRPGVYSHH